MFTDKEPPVIREVDASENAAKARSYLPFFKRGGRIPAIVDFVASGSRFRMLVPKENCKLTLVLSGVRCPKHGRGQEEPFGQEALDFATRNCLQRDVEIEIEATDKTGGFIGTIWLPSNENLSVSLLEEGLAFIHPFSADASPYTTQLYAAEMRAKTDKKNVWAAFTGQSADQENEDDDDAPPAPELHDVVVTEVIDGAHFYVQFLDGGKLLL